MTGVVDVIVEAGKTKLCDYKASTRPEPGDDGDYLEDYVEQLRLYAGLYA